MYRIHTPNTERELADYFHFRWQCLCQPLNLPAGSERDEYELVAEHCMLLDNDDEIIAVARMHMNDSDEVQIRHVAVSPKIQTKGLGKMLVMHLEQRAREQGALRAVANPRESARGFFTSCGYSEVPAAEEMNKQGRLQMVKQLEEQAHPLCISPDLVQDLQALWQESIPISSQMGVKVTCYTGFALEVSANLRKNINPHNTMFAGSIYSMAALAGWGLVHLHMQREKLAGTIVLAEGHIKYRRPLDKNPRAIAFGDEVLSAIKSLQRKAKCQFDVTVDIFAGQKVVAKFIGNYVVNVTS